MARLYTQQFALTQQGVGQTTVLPNGFLYVIRCVVCFNGSAFVSERCYITESTYTSTIFQKLIPPGVTQEFDMRIALKGGTSITVGPDTDCSMVVTGYQLQLP